MNTSNISLLAGILMAGFSNAAAPTLSAMAQEARFTRITAGPLATDVGCSTVPTACGDFDGDGYPDVFVSRYLSGLSTFYHNNRDGTFTANNTFPSQSTPDKWWGAVAADFDNDGNLDLLMQGWGRLGRFSFNEGDRTFITSEFHGSNAWNVAVADYDQDGLLDLYLSDQGHLYHNSGNRTFTRASSFGASYGQAVWADYDDDGWLELLCAGNPTRIFHCDGAGRFGSVTNLVTQSSALAGAWGDYDNDGDLDLCAASFGGATYVYRNLGRGTFERAAVGQNIQGTYNSVTWADYDNDGFLDLFLTTNGRNRLYHNNGDGTFTRIQTGSVVTDVPAGAGGDLYCYSGLWVDYDNDGFLDLYVTNGNEAGTAKTTNFLYHNDGNSNAWIKVKLVGTRSNHDGIGAKVRVHATYSGQPRWQRRDISSGDALSGNHLVAHFGLGNATNVNLVRIEWPSGAVSELRDVKSKQLLTAWEPSALKARMAPNGECLLTITAEPNRDYRIESSSDLRTWRELATPNSTSATFGYTDVASPTVGCRFYRVVGP